MDVLVLIDKLDDLVHNAKAVPLTDQVRIDREEIYDILDQMRATIPEEIKQARWIVKERQDMLAEAKREVDRLLAEAREQAVREASQTEIVKLAERQAQDIVDEARRQARETRLEMEDWADGILSTLEVNLEKFLTAVKRGRERLHERSQEHVMAGVADAVTERRPVPVARSRTLAPLRGRHADCAAASRADARCADARRTRAQPGCGGGRGARRRRSCAAGRRRARCTRTRSSSSSTREPRDDRGAEAGRDHALHGPVVVGAEDEAERLGRRSSRAAPAPRQWLKPIRSSSAAAASVACRARPASAGRTST